MLKNSKCSVLAASVITAYIPAAQADFVLVVPVISSKQANSKLQIELQSIRSADAMVGKSFELDLEPLLLIHGDPDQDTKLAKFTANNLPAGLSLNNTKVQGTPVKAETAEVKLSATYKTKKATNKLTINILPSDEPSILQENGGVRYWSNNTFAKNCLEYRNPEGRSYIYAGATGDGLYRVNMGSDTSQMLLDVWCDMTFDGGGWTMIAGYASTALNAKYVVGVIPTPSQTGALTVDQHNYFKNTASSVVILDTGSGQYIKNKTVKPINNLKNSIPMQYDTVRNTDWETSNGIGTEALEFEWADSMFSAVYPATIWWGANNINGLHFGFSQSCWKYIDCTQVPGSPAPTGFNLLKYYLR